MSRAPQFGIARAPTGMAATQPSTAHQRLYTRTLMDQQGLSTFVINERHQPYFRLAALDLRVPGRRVDAVLEELTRAEITRLIDALRRFDEPPVDEPAQLGGAA